MTMVLLDQAELKMAMLCMVKRSAFADQSFAVVHLVDDGNHCSQMILDGTG